jgi:hypothetical protein
MASLTEEQVKKRDSFFRVLNQVEVFQNGVEPETNDILKASYTPESEYKITFKENDNDRIYQLTYEGGEIKGLVPENEAVMDKLTNSPSDYFLTDNTKTSILNVSNTFLLEQESITQKINTREQMKNDYFEVEKAVKEIVHSTDTLEVYNRSKEVTNKLKLLIERDNELVEDLYVHESRTSALDSSFLRDENKDEILLELHELHNKVEPIGFGLNELEQTQQWLEVASNSAFNELRETNRLNEVFKGKEEIVQVLENTNSDAPFIRGFEERIETAVLDKGKSYVTDLTVNYQVTEPHDKIRHHLMNYYSNQDFANRPYSYFNLEEQNKVYQKSYDALDKAISIFNENMAKNEHSNYQINQEDYIKVYGGNKEAAYQEMKSLVYPAMLIKDDLNVFKMGDASTSHTIQQRDYWDKTALVAIERYVQTNTDIRKPKEYQYTDILDVHGTTQHILSSYDERTPAQEVMLEHNLKKISEITDALKRNVTELNTNSPQIDTKEQREMINFMETYENKIIDKLRDKDKENIVNVALENKANEQVNNIADNKPNKEINYKELLQQIADLQDQVQTLVRQETYNPISSMSDSMKENFKENIDKVNDKLKVFANTISEVKNSLVNYSNQKVESMYKFAYNIMDKLDESVKKIDGKIQDVKKDIEKDIENVQSKTKEPEKQKENFELER